MTNKINSWADFQNFMDAQCTAVGAKPDNAPHGRWWRKMDYQTFVANGKVLGLRIVTVGDAAGSNLIKALQGDPPFDPSGQYDRMPPGAPFAQQDIDEIKDWIQRKCPNTQMSVILTERYRARGIVRAAKGPGIDRVGQAFPPHPAEDLMFRGGRTLPNMSYKTFYLGTAWAEGSQAAALQSLNSALAAAMSDPALNDIVSQYFGKAQISTTALPSAVLDLPLQSTYGKDDIQALAEKIYMSGVLSSIDLDNCVINFVLPSGAVLSSEGGEAHLRIGRRAPPGTPEEEEEDSKHGLGGYHGSVHIPHPANPITLYYAVAVWSDGDNGIPIPGWQPWESACATLYHELNEARTDPDVEDAIRTGDVRWIGWNSRTGQEIGDFPIEEAGSNLSLVFKKVPVAAQPGTAPIQLLWSNRIHGPESPIEGPVARAAASHASVQIVSLGIAASVPPALAGGITFSPPGKLADFKKPASGSEWSSYLSQLFNDAVAATQKYLKGLPSQFFNPANGIPASDPAEQPIKWPGFPRLLENSNLSPEEQLRQAELISGTFIGRYQHQDEYLEWFVTRDPKTQKITRIDFTCEGPEYWEFLATHEPDVLLELYQKHISPDVTTSDLIAGGHYNSLNVWNTRRGAMHLIQPNNSLSAEVRIAADATILRKNLDGTLKTDAQELIECAKYGEPGRASDPHIGDLVNALARDGYVISIKDPVGLYMSRPRLVGCATPDGKQLSQDWFRVARASEDYILRGVFEAPRDSQYVAGDVTIGGVPLAYGGQIAKLIDMGLTGIAFGKGSVKDPGFPCVSSSVAASASAVTRSLGRLS